MANSDTERYYWVKISENFFDNAKIRLIQDQEYGTEATLLYIFLLAESASHGGKLRCDFNTPYTREEIGSLCRLRKEARVPAFSLLEKYRLVIMEDDGTIVLPEMPRHVGSETNAAYRKREYRERQQRDNDGTSGGQVGDNVPKSIEYREESIENNNIKKNIPPTPKPDDDPPRQPNLPERSLMELYATQRGIPIDFLDRFLAAMQETGWKFALMDGSVQKLGRSNFPFLLQAAWNDEHRSAKQAEKAGAFTPPTQEEVTAYFNEQGLKSDPREFWLYYQSRGWKSGRTQITDWKLLSTSWDLRKGDFASTTQKGTTNGNGTRREGRRGNPNAKNQEQNYYSDILSAKGLA